jgi:hypothetical protein
VDVDIWFHDAPETVITAGFILEFDPAQVSIIDVVSYDIPNDTDTTYEDAEDGTINRWYVYDNTPAGAEVHNVFDSERQSNVIQLSGSGADNGYRLTKDDGSRWNNSTRKVIEWSMKYSESFTVYVDLETTAGHRYLQYRPVNTSSLGTGEYVFYGLGTSAADGQWHTFVRDLQVDLELAQPGVTILEVNGFLIRGSGLVDDIRLLKLNYTPNYITTYEDAEDGTTDRWYVYDNTPAGAEIYNVFDSERQSNVIQLSGSGADNGYRLRQDDGSRWNNTTQKLIEWSMKYSESFTVYVDLETTAGHRYLQYRPVNTSSLGTGEYVFYGLGTDVVDGQWHTFVRDLQVDLELAQPGVTILEVNGFLIRGSGLVDNVRLLNEGTTSLPGPWDPGLTFFTVETGMNILVCGNLSCIPPDLEGDIILAKITFQCNVPGDTDITIRPISGFDTIVGCSGMVYDQFIAPSDITIHQINVYEDAEDGTTDRWYVYDNTPTGAEINNVFDNGRQSNVIEFSGAGTQNGYRLTKDDGSRWNNTTQKMIKWSMKYSEPFTVYVDVETTGGQRYLQYNPVAFDLLGVGQYVFYGLGTDAADGQWHTFVRDLQADLEAAQPGTTIVEVNGFLIRGSGRVDDIKLHNTVP